MAEEHLDANLGISRRTLIKRGAIVGGAVWAAPAITSFGSRAIGQTGTPVETNISFIAFNATCDGTLYRVKVEEDGTCEANNTFTLGDCPTDPLEDGNASETQNANFCADLDTTTNADGSITVTLPSGCSFTGEAVVKCGQCCDIRFPSGNDETFQQCTSVSTGCL